MSVNVLIADDQALVRTGFRLVLRAADGVSVVGEAADSFEAVAQARRSAPDVVLMDVRMPGLDGIEATRRIVAETTSRVLILTTFDLDEYAYEGLRVGASGFLLKDVLPEALVQAIHSVAEGDAVLTPRLTRQLVDRYARSGPEGRVHATDLLGPLTGREREVFDLLVDGLSNAQIADRLCLTESTVKTHITRLLGKLRLRDRVQVVIFAYERGLR